MRNLSLPLATAFLGQFPEGLTFMEVPVTSEDRKRSGAHLDAYLFSKGLAVLLECKILDARSHVSLIGADMARMSPQVLLQVRRRHRDPGASQARNTVAMILAETWRSENAEW